MSKINCSPFNLLEIHPLPDKKKLPIKKHLQSFCQRLIDYISNGYFSVFDKIFEAHKKHPGNKIILEKNFLNSIEKSTISSLRFNYKYSKQENKNIASREEATFLELKKDLACLMLELEKRFMIENILVNQYFKTLNYKKAPSRPKP